MRAVVAVVLSLVAFRTPATVEPSWAGEVGAVVPASLEPLLEPLRARHRLPALGGAIFTGEGLRAVGTVGLRRAGAPEMVTRDDLWHLGSCTKSMTATLLARLAEQRPHLLRGHPGCLLRGS